MRVLFSQRKSFRLPRMGAGGLFFCLLLAGCNSRPSPQADKTFAPASGEMLAPGVVHRAIALSNGTGVDIIDVDRQAAHVALQIATDHIGRVGGMIGGLAHTPREWLEKTHALAAVNGGYFGQEDAMGRKEFMGLLVQGGKVRHAAPPLTGHGSAAVPAGRYVRSAFGITSGGEPVIAYAATQPGQPQRLRASSSASGHARLLPWPVQMAVGCGPTLVQNGRVQVTDHQERLVSDGMLPRTFVAYDQNAHLVFGMASGMEYRALAEFVLRYFAHYDHSKAQAAMCLDGGASTQLSYRVGQTGPVQSPRDTGVTVPDAVVLVPRP